MTSGRRALTRERVVAEALTIIAAEGAQALAGLDTLLRGLQADERLRGASGGS